jgi:hypothetical protein
MHAIDIAFGAASVAFGVFAYVSDTIHVRRLARPAPSQFRLSSDGALVLGFADEGALARGVAHAIRRSIRSAESISLNSGASISPIRCRDLSVCAAIRARLEARDKARRLARAFLTISALALLCLALWACAADHRLTRPVQLKAIDARGELWIAARAMIARRRASAPSIPAIWFSFTANRRGAVSSMPAPGRAGLLATAFLAIAERVARLKACLSIGNGI